MARVWKKVKSYERWVLIGIVIILIATFSVTGATRSGCSRERAAGSTDWGGSFQVAPGKRVTVTDEEVREVYNRYWQIYGYEAWGPSIKFGSDMRQSRRNQELTGTWMHLVATRAAEAAGYQVGDEELREGVQEMILRVISLSGRGSGGPHDSGKRFSPEVYEQVLRQLGESAGNRGLPMTRADFEQTIREMLLKDKFLGDLVALEKPSRDRAEAFERWKPSQQRVDLQYASVPAKQFEDRVKLDEETRTSVGAQITALKKLAEAQHGIDYLTGELKKWQDQNKAAPADLKEFREKPPGSAIGKEAWNDPWGTAYAYVKAGESGKISSAGPDKSAGTADDVTSETNATLSSLGALWQGGDAVARWHTNSSEWPSALADLLKAPVPAKGQSNIPPPLREPLKDAWGHEIAWEKDAKTLRSAGPDGAPSTADDLTVVVPEGSARDATRVPWPTALAPFVIAESKDAWAKPLTLSVSRGVPLMFEVMSPGADGVPGNDDDVKEGNESFLQSYYGTVRSTYRLPLRREFEVLYAIPALVSDEVFAQAWAKLEQYRPEEKDAWDVFRQFAGTFYKYEEEEETKEEPPKEPGKEPTAPAKKSKKSIDPADKEKGYAAALLKRLRDEKKIPAEAGWQVPLAADFGDRQALSATSGLPSPDKDPLFKIYVEKGWRHVVLRDQFFEKMLDSMLKKSRTSKEAHDKWLKANKTGPETPVVTFREQFADPKLSEFQPSADATTKGARFLQYFPTTEPLKAERIEKLDDIGGIDLTTAMSSLLKDDDYAIIPNPLQWGAVRSAIHLIKRHEPAEQQIEAVRAELWPKYIEWRTFDRAASELERVRSELTKPPEPAKPGDGTPPTPVAPTAPEKPEKPDGEARAKAFIAAVEAASKARGFTFEQGRTGFFIGETARGEREPKPRADATQEQKDELARRSYVRRNAYDTVRVMDALSGARAVEPGAVGRNVLRDTPREGQTTSGRAYLAVVAAQQDPAKEEFNGKQFLSWLRDQAYDENPEWAPARVPLSDRKGYVLRALHRLYDDWDAYKVDYKVETNSDLLIPKGAGKAR